MKFSRFNENAFRSTVEKLYAAYPNAEINPTGDYSNNAAKAKEILEEVKTRLTQANELLL